MLKDTQHYHSFSTLLHWLMAFLIVAMIASGVYMDEMPKGTESRFELFQLHKSVGISVLLLTVLRVLWRLFHKESVRILNMSTVERIGSKLVHGAFYFLMFALPMSGWVAASSSSISVPTLLFGVIPWPDLPIPTGAARAEIHASSEDAHEILGYVLGGLLLLHVLAALKHHYLNQDGVLVRMAPRFSGQWPGYFVGMFFGLIALFVIYLSIDFPHQSAPLETEATLEQQTLQADSVTPALRGADWPQTWIFDQNHGNLAFYWYQPLDATKGEFTQFRAHLNLSADNLEPPFLDVDISMDKLSVDSEEAHSMLVNSEWFHALQYPTATFRSTHIEREQDAWRVVGDLRIRDHSQTVDFLLHTDVLDDNLTHVYGEFSLIRQDFGIGQGDWLSDEYVGNEVLVQFDLKHPNPPNDSSEQ